MSLPTKEVMKYINLARQYPKFYVALVDQQLNSFIDQINLKLDEEVIYQTIEGKVVWEETKLFLINQQPLRPLELHEGLAMAAFDHAQDLVKNSSNGHQGSDGSTFIDRIQRYCKKGKGSMIQLLGTTHIVPGKNSIELALLNLIIDDGVSNRGHRRAIFSKDYKYAGVEFTQKEDKIISVITMSQGNLEQLVLQPQSIATSTSHLKTLTELSPSQVKDSISRIRNSKQNFIDISASSFSSPAKEMLKIGQTSFNPKKPVENYNDPVWTLKNVTNEIKPQHHKKSTDSKQNLDSQLYPQPSIVREVDQSMLSNSRTSQRQNDNNYPKSGSNNPFSNFKSRDDQIPVKESSKASIKGPQITQQQQVKQSSMSIKNSQQSLKSSQQSIANSNSNKLGTSQGFGISSQVQKFKIKSTLQSPFLKTNTFSSSLGSAPNKRIVEKKETMRSWNEDQYIVKQVTTVLKYEDGSIQDFVQKHSILKGSSSLLQQQSM